MPTPDETKEAVSQIAAGRQATAAAALQALAEAVMLAVDRVDTSHSVGMYLKSMTLVRVGIGNYRLQIEDINAEVDGAAVAQAALDNHDALHTEYGKPLRHIQLEGTSYGPSGPTGPTELSAGDESGEAE